MKNGYEPRSAENGLTSLWSMQVRSLDALSGAATTALRQAQSLAGMYGDAISETHRHFAVELWRGLSPGSDFVDAEKALKMARRAIDASFANAIAATQLATKLQLESLAALKLATLNALNVVESPEPGSTPRPG